MQRRPGESVRIRVGRDALEDNDGDAVEVVVHVYRTAARVARIAIDAPAAVRIDRSELLETKDNDNDKHETEAAAETAGETVGEQRAEPTAAGV